MVMFYDWRDMPVKFRFYADIPDDPELETTDAWNRIDAIDDAWGKIVSEVDMVYDASGARVLKKAREM